MLFRSKEVESGKREGFISTGKPTILFEGHIFWKELEKRGLNPKKLSEYNEDIIYKNWTNKFYKGGEKEYERFQRAAAINEEAAICSTSWGMFQIMGFNHSLCGVNSPMDFFKQVSVHERNQLNMLVNFILNNKLTRYLKNKDWSGFAKLYNGSGYLKNNYAKKLEETYNKLVKKRSLSLS